MELDQALKTSLQLVEEVKKAKAILDDLVEENQTRQALLNGTANALAVREKEVSGKEAAEETLIQVKKLRADLEEERRIFEDEKVEFENKVIVEKQKLRDELDSLAPVRDQMEQVRQDKLVLIEEKKTYKEKIRKELMEKMKS